MLTTEDIKKGIAEQASHYAKGAFDSYFKYCSDKVVKGIFINHQIRFTQPRALNDPLEFNPTMRFDQPHVNYQYYEFNGLHFPSIEFFFRVQIIESQINSFGILSLTKIPNSFDMWSHYANGHKGFVLEFKEDFWHLPCMKSEKGDERSFGKVEYVEDYAINLDALVGSGTEIPVDLLLKELFFKKTSRWSYEREYRLVRPLTDSPDYKPPELRYPYTDVGMYLFPFDLECISSVILGAAMTAEDKQLVIESCEQRNIPVSQALIVKDMNDMSGKPATIYHLWLDDFPSKSHLLRMKPQLFCSDTASLGNQRTFKINKITDLPYYKGHEEIVEELYHNLKKDRDA